MNKKEEQLCEVLDDMLTNTDEDCPSEYRTKHLRSAMQDARDLLADMGYYSYDEFLEDSSDESPPIHDAS